MPLVRPRNGQENNIKMDLREIGWKIDGTGSESCLLAAFGISSVFNLCVLLPELLRSCEDGS
jgi:hypothetical protein